MSDSDSSPGDSDPSPRLFGHIIELQVQSFTLRIKLLGGSRAYVKEHLETEHEIGIVSLSAPDWTRMLRYLSTGENFVTFEMSPSNRPGAAPLELENVVGKDGNRPYWTVSGEVDICPKVSYYESDEGGEET